MDLTQKNRTGWKLTLAAALVLLCGCNRSPSINILGSFFPVWLFCAVFGVVLAFMVNVALGRVGWSAQLAPALLVYPALAVLLSLTIWLVFYS